MHGLLHIYCFYYNQPFIHFFQIFHSNNFYFTLDEGQRTHPHMWLLIYLGIFQMCISTLNF